MTTALDTAIEPLLSLAKRTAGTYGMFCGLDADEAYSILALEVAEYAHDFGVMYRNGMGGAIVNQLKRRLREHARADKIRRLAESSEHVYAPEYVRLFLPFFFDRQDWPNGPNDRDGLRPGWETADAVDTALDMRTGFPRLTTSQATVIVSRHVTAGAVTVDGDDVDWQAVADDVGYASAETARVSYIRATDQLSVNMTENRIARKAAHEGPGARRPVSNATASALIHNQY